MPKRISLLTLAAVVAGVVATFASAGPAGYAWHDTVTGTTARLRGLAAVSQTTAWASGYVGTVLRTTDRGSTWQKVGPPGTQDLQFRDIEAFDADHAVIVSPPLNGPTDSRIYVTSDGGRHWTLSFVNQDPGAFYDCMTFFDHKRGLALSDPPDGKKFRILATDDGGYSWHVVDPAGMPDALPGEAAFAASGECITSHGHTAWFGTGGAAQARVFRSDDRGRTWTVGVTPMHSNAAAGIFALAFKDERHGLAVGGDLLTPDSPDNFALTADGGTSWRLVPGAPPEYRSGDTWADGHTAIAVGPSGSDVSADGGNTWTRFDDGSLDTVDCASPTACWASGANGRAAYLVRTR